MEYIASLSYGKDSIAMLEVIHQYNLPLDRIVHVEIMATASIPADLPEMMEFKKYADKKIKEWYGIEVEHLSAPNSFEEYFYKKKGEKAKPQNIGKIYGFPVLKGAWCNSRLKLSVLNKFNCKNITRYIGIAADEPKRFHNLTERKRSPLVENNIDENWCWQWCEKNNILSPIYAQSKRSGCWFCNNQSIKQLRLLRKNYPEYWKILLKWDRDSPVPFRPGYRIADFEKRFAEEETQLSLF